MKEGKILLSGIVKMKKEKKQKNKEENKWEKKENESKVNQKP